MKQYFFWMCVHELAHYYLKALFVCFFVFFRYEQQQEILTDNNFLCRSITKVAFISLYEIQFNGSIPIECGAHSLFSMY